MVIKGRVYGKLSLDCGQFVESATGACEQVLWGHLDSVYSVNFSPDGSCVVSRSFDNIVRIWQQLAYVYSARLLSFFFLSSCDWQLCCLDQRATLCVSGMRQCQLRSSSP